MPRKSNAQRRKAAKNKQQGAPVVRLPIYPPPLSLNSNLAQVWLRNYVTVDSKQMFNDNIGSAILFQDTQYQLCFGEFKIHRVNVWYIPSTAVVTTPGEYAFAIVDAGEVAAGDKEFKIVANMPGSVVRKMYMTASGTWFPTEPADRGWQMFDNTWSIFSVRIATTGTNKVAGYIVYDAHLSFRSTAAATAKVQHRAPAEHVPRATLEERLLSLETALKGVVIAP